MYKRLVSLYDLAEQTKEYGYNRRACQETNNNNKSILLWEGHKTASCCSGHKLYLPRLLHGIKLFLVINAFYCVHVICLPSLRK